MENIMMKDLKEVLITEEQIQKRVKELAQQISKDYENDSVVCICILKGGSLFFADLVRELTCQTIFEFMAVSSYGSATRSSGEVKIIKDCTMPVEGRNIIFVEDIVDSGYTLRYLTKLFEARGCKSIKICSLLDKPSRRQTEVKADYKGFEIEDKFVVGYGLDYDGEYRNLRVVGVLKEEVYNKKEETQDKED